MKNLPNTQRAKDFYVTAGVTAIVFVCLIIVDVAASFIAGKSPEPGTLSSVDVFQLFETNPFRGFQYLGLLNVIEQILMLAIVYAFYLSHREVYRNGVVLTLVLFALSLAVYIANNASLPLYSLSQKYASAGPGDKILLAAAGESLLARGEDFALGSLPGFLVNEVSVFLMLFIMLKGKVFSKASAIIGLIGTLLLTVFTFGATLNPPMYNTLMTMSLFGGLLMLVWYILIALELFKMARKESAN